jgi:hypothetical protein
VIARATRDAVDAAMKSRLESEGRSVLSKGFLGGMEESLVSIDFLR